MFLVSTRVCLIACRFLVQGYLNEKRMTAPEIAKEFNVNVRSVNPGLRQLVRAGILRSMTGGTNPGFIFAKDPKSISLFDIVYTLEGEINMLCCRDIIKGVDCNMDDCAKCLVYGSINNGFKLIHENLKSISIYDHYLSCNKFSNHAL